MKKIKILFYSHAIDFRGTWRAHEKILLNLNKEIFDIYVFYNPRQDNNRLEYLRTQLPSEKIIEFETSPHKTCAEKGWTWEQTNFSEIAKSYNFDIIHVARSGYFEWPFTERLSPIQIETNIFGQRDYSGYLDYSVTISDTVTQARGGSDKMIYNPVQSKINDNSNLFDEYNIPKNIPVFGRINNDSDFFPIAFDALYEFKKMGNDFRYIIIAPCQDAKNKIKELDLTEQCILIEPTNDDFLIHRFYNTIDIFLHYRSNGETFGVAIAHSMMYGKPVISHTGGAGAQFEIIGDSGYVCHNTEEYLSRILELTKNKEKYQELSKKSSIRALDFDEKKIAKEWEDFYLEKYIEKNIK
jgi:glycosyltransferase involved in cell wall biosynthesis